MPLFLRRVALKNYKSIASCDVTLPSLCFLVGRNGAGSILVVSNESGNTTITPVDEASRTSIRDGLFTAGELLRMDQHAPDERAGAQRAVQFDAAVR